jgi:hypothetical protein
MPCADGCPLLACPTVITPSATDASPSRSPEGLIIGRSAPSRRLSMGRAPGAPRSRGAPDARSGDDPEMTAPPCGRGPAGLGAGCADEKEAGRLVTRPPGSRPILQRFWGTVWRDGKAQRRIRLGNPAAVTRAAQGGRRHCWRRGVWRPVIPHPDEIGQPSQRL